MRRPILFLGFTVILSLWISADSHAQTSVDSKPIKISTIKVDVDMVVVNATVTDGDNQMNAPGFNRRGRR